MICIPPRALVFGCALLTLLTASPSRAVAQAAGKKKPAVPEVKGIPAVAPTVAVATGATHLRIWKADLPGVLSARVTLQPLVVAGGKKGVSQEIAKLGPGYQFGDYTDVPAGKCVLESFISDQPQPFASVIADLSAGSFSTLLVSRPEKAGASPRTALILDAEDEKTTSPNTADVPAQFSVRNLAPGVHDLRVSVGDNLMAQFSTGNAYLQMTGLQRGIYGVRTTGKDAEGKPFEWTTEGNFEHSRRQTLLIYPDPYGRVRPRLYIDGPSEPAADTSSQEPASKAGN
jgi:hypothetical protein